MKKNQKFGFTLIEVIIVTAVLGILSALFLTNYNTSRLRARDSKRKTDLNQVVKALVMYRNDYGNLYPANSGDQISACSLAATKAWGSPFVCGSMVYMRLLPQDPSGGTATYKYRQIDSGGNFCLWATLENTADPDIAKYWLRCSAVCENLKTAEDIGNYDIVLCSD